MGLPPRSVGGRRRCWVRVRRWAGALLAGRVAPGFFSCISNVTRRGSGGVVRGLARLVGVRERIDDSGTPGPSAPPPRLRRGTERGDSGPLIAARYLGKYAGKAVDGERPAGLHRYEVAQGFKPVPVVLRGPGGRGRDSSRRRTRMGSEPSHVWHSARAGWLAGVLLPVGWRGMTDRPIQSRARVGRGLRALRRGCRSGWLIWAVLAQVAGLLGAAPGPGRGRPQRAAFLRQARQIGVESVGVEAVVATPGGCDGDVVDDGGDDRVLPGRAAVIPSVRVARCCCRCGRPARWCG